MTRRIPKWGLLALALLILVVLIVMNPNAEAEDSRTSDSDHAHADDHFHHDGDEDHSHEGDQKVLDLGPAEALEHTASMLVKDGLEPDLETARAAIDRDMRANDVSEALYRTSPDRFAGAQVVNGIAVIRVKGKVDSTILSTAGKTQPDVMIRGGASHSLDELRGQISLLSRELERAGQVFEVAIVEDGVIEVGVAANPGAAAASAEAVRSVAGDRSHIRVSLTDPAGSFIQDQHTYGGEEFNGNGWCTTAFSVKKNGSNTKGVLTAAHCNGTYTYKHTTGGQSGTHSTAYKAGFLNIYGDAEWRTTSGAEKNKFYVQFHWENPNNWPVLYTAYKVKAPWTMMVNESICMLGITSGSSCANVNGLYTELTTSSGTVGGLIRTNAAMNCTGGDSGGPVFKGGWPWGITKGVGTSSSNNGMCYSTPAMTAEVHLDVDILALN